MISGGGIAAQFTRIKGRAERLERSWIARAISSFPVPVSPRIKTVESVGATPPPFSQRELYRQVFSEKGVGGEPLRHLPRDMEACSRLVIGPESVSRGHS